MLNVSHVLVALAADPAAFAARYGAGIAVLGEFTGNLDNDGELDDSVLEFVSWNRARYRWNAPVRVATVAGHSSRTLQSSHRL